MCKAHVGVDNNTMIIMSDVGDSNMLVQSVSG